MDNVLLLILSIASIHLMAVISPGPNFLVVTRNSLTYSRHVGLFTARGVTVGASLYVCTGMLGFAAIVSQSALVFNTIKVLGTAYFLVMGVKSLLAFRQRAADPAPALPGAVEAPAPLPRHILSDRQAFASGFLTNMSNPKSALYYLLLFTTLVPATAAPPLKIALGLVMVAITLTWYTLVALTFSTGRVQHVYQRVARGMNLVFGALWIGLGIKLVTTKA